MLSAQKRRQFREKIYNFYAQHGRTFAWRQTDDPYRIVVSEIMLQQTQTHRVAPKYEQFLAEFSTFNALAHAPLRDVLSLWSGLGYNRRALYLHRIAQKVMGEYVGNLPEDPVILQTFPGLGAATASSICAFAFNKPTVFIETNIRTVYLHEFFLEQDKVADKELLPLIEQTVCHEQPRLWYYALMDYGVMLKSQHKNPSRRSKHHIKQSTFEGSDRQIRGAIIRSLGSVHSCSFDTLCVEVGGDEVRVQRLVADLVAEGLLEHMSDDQIRIA